MDRTQPEGVINRAHTFFHTNTLIKLSDIYVWSGISGYLVIPLMVEFIFWDKIESDFELTDRVLTRSTVRKRFS